MVQSPLKLLVIASIFNNDYFINDKSKKFKNYKNFYPAIFYDKNKDILYIYGKETYIPGILDKTIQAFDIIHNKMKIPYDFIFRTNISTFVHFKNTLQST